MTHLCSLALERVTVLAFSPLGKQITIVSSVELNFTFCQIEPEKLTFLRLIGTEILFYCYNLREAVFVTTTPMKSESIFEFSYELDGLLRDGIIQIYSIC